MRVQTAVALILALCGAARAETSEGARILRVRVGEAPRVQVEAVLGDVAVEAGPAGEVEIVAALSGADAAARARWRVEAFATSTGAVVRASCDERPSAAAGAAAGACGAVRIDLMLRVPQASALAVSGVASRIEVRGVRGDLALDTALGDVKVEGGGAVSVSTLDGAIRVDSAREVEATTRGGDLVLRGVPGLVRVRTASGQASVEALGEAPSLDFRAQTGSLRWRGLCAKGCRLHARSGKGDLRFDVDEESSFKLAHQSEAGALHDGLHLPIARVDAPAAEAVGRYQGGSGEIRTRTRSGDLWLAAE